MNMIRFLPACLLFSVAITGLADDNDTDQRQGVAIALRGTPKVDGKIDDLWKSCPKHTVALPITELLKIEQKDMATATVQLLWDGRHLYALWVVNDAALSAESSDDWAQDSVELFLDQHQDKSTTYQADDAQYRVNFQGKRSGQGTGYDEADLKAVAARTKKGYRVEMSIRTHAADMKPGTVMGLELQVNDDHGSGQRDAITKWLHPEDDSWQDTSKFGTVQLK